MGELMIFKVLSTPYILRYFPLMRQKKCLRTQQSAVCSLLWGFPSGSGSKESVCNARDPGLIPGSGRSPEEGNGYPFQYSCLENSTQSLNREEVWGSGAFLVNYIFQIFYSPWSCKESDLTERLTLSHFHLEILV